MKPAFSRSYYLSASAHVSSANRRSDELGLPSWRRIPGEVKTLSGRKESALLSQTVIDDLDRDGRLLVFIPKTV
jgi:hypothetical protein